MAVDPFPVPSLFFSVFQLISLLRFPRILGLDRVQHLDYFCYQCRDGQRSVKEYLEEENRVDCAALCVRKSIVRMCSRQTSISLPVE